MDYVEEISSSQNLAPGDIIRREKTDRRQQGVFVKYGDDGALVVCDVVDLTGCSFLAEAGVMRPNPEDRMYRLTDRFGSSQKTEAARQIVQSWTLYREHPELQKQIVSFVESVYSPAQISDLNRDGQLKELFVPIQEKFKIGKFREKIDWSKVRAEQFSQALNSLSEGKHMTYVAFIPGDQAHDPLFYTIGTKPHQETITALGREPFAFKPTHAGHIKMTSAENEPRAFVVDAGSNFLGAGIHTSLATAEMVTDALHELFPDYAFIPMAGRGAFGIQQSY